MLQATHPRKRPIASPGCWLTCPAEPPIRRSAALWREQGHTQDRVLSSSAGAASMPATPMPRLMEEGFSNPLREKMERMGEVDLADSRHPATQPPRCIARESHINGSRTQGSRRQGSRRQGVADATRTLDHYAVHCWKVCCPKVTTTVDSQYGNNTRQGFDSSRRCKRPDGPLCSALPV